MDELAGLPHPQDTHYPEDWLASTTRALNPPDAGTTSTEEGIASVQVGAEQVALPTLLARDPRYFLGADHVARHGPTPALLVKLLDPAIRLHFQVHPTAEFAQRRLGAPSGKTEAYHVLAVRPEVAEPCIYLGFTKPPARADLRRWIEAQNIPALTAALNRIPVRPGDTYLVPGGVPHALGEGILLVEIQEPSDLVVRFEFERGGYVLPESARFMNRDLDFALDVFDLSPWSPERLALHAPCPPRRRRALGLDSYQDDLIGPERTPCFRLRRSVVQAPVVKREDHAHVLIVTAGSGTATVGPHQYQLHPYRAFLVPAALGPIDLHPESPLHLLEAYPPT